MLPICSLTVAFLCVFNPPIFYEEITADNKLIGGESAANPAGNVYDL
jgi:hypothetical protein